MAWWKALKKPLFGYKPILDNKLHPAPTNNPNPNIYNTIYWERPISILGMSGYVI